MRISAGIILVAVPFLFLNSIFVSASEIYYDFNCRDFGAVGDAKTDDTGSIQKALDEAGAQGGGVVLLPAGTYRIEGHLTIPPGVTLQGIFQGPHHEDQTWGSALFAIAGRDDPEGEALINLRPSTAVRGIKIYYPEQKISDIHPYPYAIRGRGMESTVENVTFVNAFQGIDYSAAHELHTIRNVRGCVLRRGIFIDQCTDIGRIENVHFNPHFWSRMLPPPGEDKGFPQQAWPKLVEYVRTHAEIFIFGRSDWEYVLNTFAWGFKSCYKFIETESGMCNGNFLGIGADGGYHSIYVEQCFPYGLLITNGEFVSFDGIQVVTAPTFTGVLQLNNCSFWGPAKQCVLQQGAGLVSLQQCNFHFWDIHEESLAAVETTQGDLSVVNCFFQQDRRHIKVGQKAGEAILLGNRFKGKKQVEILNQE
jgi:hypothetical protein